MRKAAGWTAILVLAALAAARPAAALTCDGRGDARAALNQALAAGGQVRLPAGLCLVSGSVFVPSNTTVSGAGAGRTIIKSAVPTPSFPVVSIGHGTPRNGAHDVDISALTVDGSARGRGAGDPNGLEVAYGSGHVRLHDLEVFGAGGNGISVGTSDVDVDANSVHDNQANGIYVIGKANIGGGAPVRTERVRILRNRVSHNSRAGLPPARPSWDGIDIDPITADCLVQGNTVTGNDIILFENAKRVPSSGGHRVVDNVVTGSVESGINVIGAIDGFQLLGNRMERIEGWGVVVNGPVRHGVIRGNVITGATRDGIMFTNATSLPGAPSGVVVSGNTIAPGPGTPGPGAPGPGAPGRVAVLVRNRANDISITGNTLILAPGVAAVDARAAGPGIVVRGNR